MHTFRSLSMVAVATMATITFGGCGASETTQPIDHASLHAVTASAKQADKAVANGNVAALAKMVAAASARFHSNQQAAANNYVEGSPCVSAGPLGGMGYHYVNESLVDNVFDPLNPEVMLYEPDKHGKLKLVAVEYIVINTGQPAPTFAGQPFDVNGSPLPIPHWALHVWVHKDNPSGMFAPFNPNVSCPAP